MKSINEEGTFVESILFDIGNLGAYFENTN